MPVYADVCITVLWAGVCVYGIHRASSVAERLIATTRPLVTPSRDDDVVEIPNDLVAVAMQYPDSWAQEDTIKAIRERYEKLHDWNLVRSAFNVGRIDG